jgi:hypothetical protein
MLDQSYINLFILVIIVAIVMFLWRKLIILEGNFFVLEKRVNIIKKDAREDSIAKNIDKADIIMNEIFKDYAPLTPSNACKQSVCGGSGVSGAGEAGEADDAEYDGNICYPQEGGAYNIPIGESVGSANDTDQDIITFANGGNTDIDMDAADAADAAEALAASATTINSSEEYEKKFRIELIDTGDAATYVADANAGDDTMSVCSEITFTTDDKKNEKALAKKYTKMSLDKLKDVCGSLNISGEGTRNELINRIITVKK